MIEAMKKPRLRALALTVVMALLTGFAAVTLVSSGALPAQAVGLNPGLRGAAANPFYVYMQAGEFLTARGAVTTHPAGGGTGLTKVVDPDGNEYPISTAVNHFSQQATQDGVWQVYYDTTYAQGSWEINVTTGPNESGTYRSGRVWANSYIMTDTTGGNGSTLEFWVMDDSGYRYKVTLHGYTGIASVFSPNALGITEGGDECIPVYRSIEYTDLSADIRGDCSDPFRIFFEPPAPDLPASAMINGNEQWVAPPELLIEELTDSALSFVGDVNASAPGAGVFSTAIDPRFKGSYFLEIDADGDNNFNGPNDRRVQLGATGSGAYTYTFDGLDNSGDPFPACTPMNARLTFETVGEIHMIQNDVEKRSGIEIQKLNGIHAGTPMEKVIYWDDTHLGFNRTNTINPPYDRDGTAGYVSGPNVHGWNYHATSWGDLRLIDDWTFTPLQAAHSEPVTITSYCPQPAIEIGKNADFTSGSQPGDTITYTVTATNTGDGAYDATHPAVVLDDLSGILDDAVFDVLTLTADRTGDLNYEAPLVSWVGELAPGDTVTITYEVTLRGGGDGEVRNIAWQPEDPEDTEPPTECDIADPTCADHVWLLPKLTVHKETSSDVFAGTGDTIEYSITVTNPGPGDFTWDNPATMTDNLADVLASGRLVGTPTSDLGDVTVAGDTLEWAGVLAHGQTATITYTVEYTASHVNGQDALLENTACVPEMHVAQGAHACARVATPGPILSQWKTVTSIDDPVVSGSVLTYTLHFENSGQAPIEVDAVDRLDFVVDDADVTTEPSSSDLTVSRVDEVVAITGSLPAGETYTVTYQVTAKSDGERGDSQATNFLLNAGEEPPAGGSCEVSDEERPSCTTTIIFSSILIEKLGQGPTGAIPLSGAQFHISPQGEGDVINVTEEVAVGSFLVDGLVPGTYTLTETKAPEGYTLLAEPVTFAVLPSGAIDANENDSVRVEDDGNGTWKLVITDASAFALPLSGGLGDAPWILGGLLVAGLALVIPLVRARREPPTYASRA